MSITVFALVVIVSQVLVQTSTPGMMDEMMVLTTLVKTFKKTSRQNIISINVLCL